MELARTGETLTQTVVTALRERLKREGAKSPLSLKQEIMEISRRAAALPRRTGRGSEAERFAEAIENDAMRLMSGASVLETSLVIESELGDEGGRELDLLMLRAGIEIVAFTEDQLTVARHAYRSYGKGRHGAGLDYGDCLSYALSRTTGEPLLFKGRDFSRTDVVPCPESA